MGCTQVGGGPAIFELWPMELRLAEGCQGWLWMFFSSSFCEDFVSKLSNVNHHIERVGCKWYTTNSKSKFLCREFILSLVLLHLFAFPPKSSQWMEKGSRGRRLISFSSSLIVVALNHDGRKNEVFMVKRNPAIACWDIFEALAKNWRSSNINSFCRISEPSTVYMLFDFQFVSFRE